MSDNMHAILGNRGYQLPSLYLVLRALHLLSFPHQSSVEEKLYPAPVPAQTMIELVENVDESRLDALTPTLIDGWPNTYTFSKAIAENAVKTFGHGLPICVVRPSIVVPTYLEPVPGWLDISNVFGPSGIILGSGIGLVRTLWVDPNVMLDLVPVDYVNNLTIAASWDTVQRSESGDTDLKFYTVSCIRNRFTWVSLRQTAEKVGRKLLSPKTVWYCDCTEVVSRRAFQFYTLLLHLVPALLVDTVLAATGLSNIRLTRIYKKAYKLNTTLSYFLIKTFDWHDDNTLALFNKLSKTDQEIFTFDIARIDYRNLMIIWWLGLRKFIIKDELKGTEMAVKRQPYLKVAHYVISLLYIFCIYKVLSLVVSLLMYLVSFVF
ncbi:hypothetical protein JYU34_021664 [Plutella xylostella]|uniref:Fatty acyl-CoA reductase n=1 Tax=Plutella xylostella TaxID=51655 RepID=A0ABQ7PSS9_PLUXY|nr:hypothetical protein JYU34_021664 [Plutella xylostella]